MTGTGLFPSRMFGPWTVDHGFVDELAAAKAAEPALRARHAIEHRDA